MEHLCWKPSPSLCCYPSQDPDCYNVLLMGTNLIFTLLAVKSVNIFETIRYWNIKWIIFYRLRQVLKLPRGPWKHSWKTLDPPILNTTQSWEQCLNVWQFKIKFPEIFEEKHSTVIAFTTKLCVNAKQNQNQNSNLELQMGSLYHTSKTFTGVVDEIWYSLDILHTLIVEPGINNVITITLHLRW